MIFLLLCLMIYSKHTSVWTGATILILYTHENGRSYPFFRNIPLYFNTSVSGCPSPDNKYVGRINLRITLECGTDVDLFLQYDSHGEWEHKFNMNGTGTRTFSIPIIPKRCDHFKYKIKGKGACKIHSITKSIEEGSDG